MKAGDFLNAFILAIPIILIRYVFMRIIDKEAMERANFFPPTEGKEKIAFYVYQITSIILFVFLFFSDIKLNTIVNYLGIIVYLIGTILYMKSIIDFSKPETNGINKNGLYKYSRNPMYLAFFLYFLGCNLLINSWLYFVILLIFQISVHYLILSEERWCIKKFGEEYKNYMKQVRRYI